MSEPDHWDLAALTAENLADWPSAGESSIFEIEKGGSGRRFFRISRGGPSVVLMHYTLDRPENADFAPITDFLCKYQIPVPKILARDEPRNLLWIEDLGEADLWLIRDADWESVRRPAYEATLEAVARIHQLTESDLENRSTDKLPHFQPPFDAAMYHWEQDYFFERYVARFAEIDREIQQEIRSSAPLADLIDNLVALPRTLVHRDFQSQNVMLPNHQPRFIDYQGMRYGRPEYDVASLLFDPYVPFSEQERIELARHYHRVAEDGSSFDEFENRLLRCGAQRLMQALGAYGFLGIDKQQSAFLDHIEPALTNLRWIAVERDILPALAPLLKLGGNGVA
jgi:aminoglycoside/choline kinase family phosphotransferase